MVGNGNREEEADPDTYNQRASTDYVQDVWSRLALRIPGIADGQLAHGYAGLYTTTPDLHPVMDRVDGIDGLYICTGFSGHGFKLAPAVGVCMSELILDGESKLVGHHPSPNGPILRWLAQHHPVQLQGDRVGRGSEG